MKTIKANPSDSDENGTSARYCRGEVLIFPIGDKGALAYLRTDNSVQIITSSAAKLLNGCRTLRTLEEHACVFRSSALLQEAPSLLGRIVSGLQRLGSRQSHGPSIEVGNIDHLVDQMKALAEARLLVSEKALLSKYKSVAKLETSPAKIASVVIPTRERVKSLQRCLLSYVENCKQYGRANDFVVADDSPDTEVRTQTRSMLKSIANRFGAEIYYAGLEEKLRFVDELVICEGAPPDILNFALLDTEGCAHSTGANRNALLLHTVGDMIFSADDDTICRTTRAPDSHKGLTLCSGLNPFEFWFFPSREIALESASLFSADLLGSHEYLLGRSLSSIIASDPGSLELVVSQEQPGQLHRPQSGEGRVLATFNGALGNAGTESSFWLLMVNDDSRERLLRSEDSYKSACASEEILRVTRKTSISDTSWCMTTALGFDNRELLPPFMPVMRNQDGLFGVTLRMCFQNAYFGHVPWAILHARMAKRSSHTGQIKAAEGYRMQEIVLACVNSAQLSSLITDPTERLRVLGKHLIRLGSMKLADFKEFIRIQLWHLDSIRLLSAERRLRDHHEFPDFWARDLKNYTRALRQNLLLQDCIVPLDLIRKNGSLEAELLVQRLVLKFGKLLSSWPDIVNSAKMLRMRGIRLANRL